MSNKLSFGMYEGKTYEWLFFKAPWYAEWIYDNGIYQQRHNFSEEEAEHFLELFHRAWQLNGTCRWCNERPVTRMGLSTHHRSNSLGHVGFYCDECEYMGGSPTSYHRPSFFLDTHTIPRCEQLMIAEYIKTRYIGGYERLTQRKMEEFFWNDGNFVHAETGYFTNDQASVPS